MRTPETRYIFNTSVLSNFAAVGQVELLGLLYRGRACTTVTVGDELRRGINAGYQYLLKVEEHLSTINPAGWLKVLSIETSLERQLYVDLSSVLDPGEASCLALAISRRMTFATDDLAARRLADEHKVPLTGTLGILIRLVREQYLSLEFANGLLAKMIQLRYRAPVKRLDDFI